MAKDGAGTAPAAKPKAVTVEAGTVRVMLGDQPAAGLFVLYRVAPQPEKDDGKGNALIKLLDATPPPAFTLGFVDGQGFLQKVVADGNPWHELSAQIAELESAVTGGAGKLGKAKAKKTAKSLSHACEAEKLHAEVEYEFALVAHPSVKVAKAALEFLQTGKVSGPYPFPKKSADLVLRGKLTVREEKGASQLVLSIDTLATGKKLSGVFWPAGSSRYEGWVLYRLMPYDHLDEVKKQVRKLYDDLAAIRYPSSLGQEPYPAAGSGAETFAIHIAAIVHRFQRAVAENQVFQLAPKKAGGSGALTKATAPAGWRTLPPSPAWDWLSGKVVTDLKLSYSFTKDQVHPGVVDARVGDALVGFAKDGLRHPGAVLIETGAQMEGVWNVWGRPELIFPIEMLRVMLCRLGVPYGAAMTHTYRPVASPGGTGRAECSNHKLGLAVDFAIASAAGGKADIQDHGHPAEHFPVRYQAVYGDPALPPLDKLQKQLEEATQKRAQAEADVTKAKADLAAKQAQPAPPPANKVEAAAYRKELASLQKQVKTTEGTLAKAEKTEEQAAAALQKKHDIGDTKADQNLSWIICAHSHWDIFAKDKTAEQIADELAKCLGKPEKPEDPWDVEREYRNLLLSGFTSAPVGYAAELVDTYVKRLRDLCASLTAMDPVELRHQLFRQTVRQFDYNPFERDGGDEGPEITPDCDEAWKSAYVDASKRFSAFHMSKLEPEHKQVHSFVNFSRLANECDLWGISAVRGNAKTKGSFRNPMADPDIPDKPPPRISYPVNAATFPALASLLESLKSAGAEAVDDQVDITMPDGKQLSMKVGDLDVDFLVAWAEEMGKGQWDRIEKPADRKDPVPPPAVSWSAGDVMLLVYPTTDKEIEAFCNTFSEKSVRIVSIGPKLGLKATVGAADTLAEVSNQVTTYLAKLAKEKGNAEPGAQPGAKPAAKSKSSTKDSKKSTKKVDTDYVITLRPIFKEKDEVTFPVGATVTLPAHGVPAPLEWWHHESGVRGTDTYAKNAEDLGYSQLYLSTSKEPPVEAVAPEVGGFGYPEKSLGIVRKLRKVQTGGAPEAAAEEGDSDG